ncbi:2-phospho-L-lactate guanylyltransferase [Pengzhenrongella frigida]|uniref:Phosphoenolpyruvate guanylyltransferase n=1 Tax=Pengzhenrongella frigida TaxID=1259133 RepID=A0A4Q5N4V1_9MICO|nr:2-phospho-L-lactate guanylyltransferase [Cellulomonas sp. HLT2-17]RYV51737.1 2-phospho-L-lactate guanylyltransferase [Cellulomonas sp. HLT2-17]
MTELRWTLVVPIKAASEGKTRLADWLEPGPRAALARAMVGDTLAAGAAVHVVDRIIVVTADRRTADAARRAVRGASAPVVLDVVGEPDPAGLNPAVRAGLDRARLVAPAHGVAVLLGDLPALRAADLEAALVQAASHPLALVADAAGTGTTLLTALPGQPVDPAFGPGSAGAHEARGHVRLVVPPGSGLANDVDVRADLEVALTLGVGTRTRRALHGTSGPPARDEPLP